jgi:hypothetical protein
MKTRHLRRILPGAIRASAYAALLPPYALLASVPLNRAPEGA